MRACFVCLFVVAVPSFSTLVHINNVKNKKEDIYTIVITNIFLNIVLVIIIQETFIHSSCLMTFT